MLNKYSIILCVLFLGFIAFTQENEFSALKNKYDLFSKEEKYDSALVIANQMKTWALQNETDTSLNYAVSLRYVGNCYYYYQEYKLAVEFWKSSNQMLESRSRINSLDNFLVLKYLVQYYIQTEDYKKADLFFNKAKLISHSIFQEDDQNYFDFMEEIAGNYNDVLNYSKAIENYEIILSYLTTHDKIESVYYSKIISLLGVAYFMNQDYMKAKSFLEDALNRSVHNGIDSIQYANNATNLGLTLVELGEFDQALDYYDHASHIYAKSNSYNRKNFAKFLNNFANLLTDLDKYEEAEKKYQEAIDIYRKDSTFNSLGSAQCLLNYAILKANTEQFRESEKLLSQSISITRSIQGEKDPDYINSLVNLATLKSEMGETNSALEDYISASNLAYQYLPKNSQIYLNCIYGIGSLYHELTNYQKAEYFLLKALEGYKKSSSKRTLNYSACLEALGILYMDLASYYKAEKYLREANNMNAELLDDGHSRQARTLLNLTSLMVNKGELIDAKNLLEKQISKFKDIYGFEHSILAKCYNNLANIYADLSLDSLAIYYYDKSLQIYSIEDTLQLDEMSMVYYNLGGYYLDHHFFSKAYDCYSKSLAIDEMAYGEMFVNANPNVIYNIGVVCWENRQFSEAILKFKTVSDVYLQNLNTNFSWLSAQEKQAYWEREKDFYQNMNSFSVSAVDSIPTSTELSYNTNLISKSLLLETSRELDQAIAQSSDEDMKIQFSEMKQLRKLYSKMQSEGSTNKVVMERYKSQADSLDKILANKLGKYAASNRKFEITWKDVQSNLATTDAAIEFARYYDDKDSLYKYMALVARLDYKYPKLVNLGEEVAIRTAAQNKDFSALFNEAWKGIDSLLVGVKRVYYSPAGELNNVSFSALCTEEGKELLASNIEKNRGVVIGNNKTTTKPCNSVLMDKYELHQLTTTRYLADGTLKKEKPMQLSLALVGGINFDDIPEKTIEADKEQSNEDFAFHSNLNKQISTTNGKKRGKRNSSNYGKEMPFLEGTKEEVNNISDLMTISNWKVQTKSDKKASEYEFKKELETKAPGVLHIATHGFAFPDEAKKQSKLLDMNQSSTYKVSEDPMVRCGLMLGGSNISWTGNPQKMIEQTGDDGILTAAEVANLDLSKTKLVVLSACETGLGKIEGSEGTFGLKRGFKLAGVEQMIVSLWSVPDKETMELMTLFYSDLTKTLNPIISFEKAQKEMRNRYPTEPEKWAGFVLVR